MNLQINIVDGKDEYSSKIEMPWTSSGKTRFMHIFSKFVVPAFLAAGYSEKEIQAEVEEWYGVGRGGMAVNNVIMLDCEDLYPCIVREARKERQRMTGA